MWFYTSAKLPTIRLLVSRSKPWSTILRRVITIKPWYDGTEAVGTYITSPTGNTRPPRTLTIPGFEAVRPAEPPLIIRSRRPPKDNITPART